MKGSPKQSLWLGIALPYLSPDQGKQISHVYDHWCLKVFPWVHASNWFCAFKCWNHPWISSIFMALCSDNSYPWVPVWSCGGGSEILFVTLHEFLTYLYEKYVILKLSVRIIKYAFVLLHINIWGISRRTNLHPGVFGV